MERRLILTIGREMGSGGRDLAQYLARTLDLKFYDKELIHEASKDSGICKDCFEKADEKPQKVWYSRFPFFGDPGFNGLNNDNLFEIQYHTVQRLAKEHNCVFVGRCTDYILREDPACLNIFVHAPKDFRVRRICRSMEVNEEEAVQIIEKTDKIRSSYYNFYTNKEWGKASSYHLSIDTSLSGVEKTAEFVAEWVKIVTSRA
ncbi:MAG: cytidylate kinase-like family protein [Bacteroides sp.]|nr:cytidylate kinase-like family protein [Bacteroides sp.]MCM1085866.1 cytidylate kinase-like family protein [Bacteroides sp.]